jgi:hypothetical protein
MALGDKQTAKVSAFAGPFMEQDEHVVAVLGQGLKGPSAMFVALVSSLLAFAQTPYAIVVTERRVLLIRLKMALTGYPPKNLEGAFPRSSVKATFSGGSITGKLVLEGLGAEPLNLSIQRIYLDGAAQVAFELSKAAAAAVASASDTPLAGHWPE